MNTLNKIAAYASFTTLGIAFIALFIGIAWMVYPYKPLEVKNQPIPVFNKEVNAGDYLKIRVEFCKNMDIPGIVTRSFIDDIIFTTPSVITDKPIGCDVSNTQIYVPENLPTGKYFLKTVYDYKVNPIRNIHVTTVSEEFYVLGKDLDKQADED